MARPKASPEQREQQRERLRRAAAEVYQEHGLAGITARAVCLRAGVSTGTLYSYFASLEELMQSLWIEPVARLNQQVELALADVADPLEQIRFLLEAYAGFAADSPDVFRGAVLFVRPSSIPAPDPQPPDELPFHRLLRSAVVDGQAAGLIRSGDPTVIAQTLWAGIHGAVGLPVNIDRYAIEPQHVLATAMIDTLFASIAV